MMNNETATYYGVKVSENPELAKWMKDVDEFLDTLYHDRDRHNGNYDAIKQNFNVVRSAHNKLVDRIEALESATDSLHASCVLSGLGLLAISVSSLMLWWCLSDTDEQVAQLTGEMETMREKIRDMADKFDFIAK
jgi:hypothetical protein